MGTDPKLLHAAEKRHAYAQVAAKAHTSLCTFASVVHLLENSRVRNTASARRSAQRIIKICQEEQQRQLKQYDKAIHNVRVAK